MHQSSWVLFLRGILAIIFGVLAFTYPGLTIALLIMFFGIYVCANGLITIIFSIVGSSRYGNWWCYLLEGIMNIIIGLLIFFWPRITGLIVLYLIAAWAVATGILQLIAFISGKKDGVFLSLSGLLSLLIGIYLFRFPGAGVIALAWIIGFYVMLLGFFYIVSMFHGHREPPRPMV
ncbi:MAG: DUF308 domain-containing protein [Gammaproteobacteria bacterium]|jgi:uncharacterized membrane protein HdeD (DUF308 family)